MTSPTRTENAQVQELKPCPFCGSVAEVLTDTLGLPMTVRCTNKKCGVTMYIPIHEGTVDRWNRRVKE